MARRTYEKLGGRLVGLELGNERQDSRSPPVFTKYFLEDLYTISEAAFGDRYKQIYSAGTFTTPALIQCEEPDNAAECYSTESLFENDIDEHGIIKYADTHQSKGNANLLLHNTNSSSTPPSSSGNTS
ncbi:uncharacterized protein BDV17DRAFT_295824 [Aspergillus undulatus]|uniref:uncharacterized protein n=1 Tax=Aspergillus undulatus TaxID=1810928 RepID=UPI003CCDEECC